MDIVTKSFFDKFKQEFGYLSIPDNEAFELFTIFCVLSKYDTSETINDSLLDDIQIGNGGDWGIDGFIIVVNGKSITTKQEVEDLLSANGYLEVTIVLVQAKTSETFSSASLGQFLDGVDNVFGEIVENRDLPTSNESLTKYRDIIKYIYSKSADFKDGRNPRLYLYYATCGQYNAQADFTSKIAKSRKALERMGVLSCYGCELIGKNELVSMYKSTKESWEVKIRVENKMSLPEVENISESYLCLIPFREFKQTFIDGDGKIINSVFYDNIRSYQGDNLVNHDMSASLKSGNLSLFTAMNNGVTLIAKSVQVSGVYMVLNDLQIVNGCQTCNVLYQNKDIKGIDDLMLSVKIISSTNKEIRDKIIVGNNSQTEVKREQLVSLLDSQRRIEDYYNAQNKYEKLYYERRSKQYKFENVKIPQGKIITIPFQIKAFVSMIIGEPHKVSGYYGSVVEQYEKTGNKLFSVETNPAFYYTSALASYKMNEAFHSWIPRKYKQIKFHVLLAFRLKCENGSLPALSSNKSQAYCDHLCSILCNTERCKDGFKAALQLIDTSLKRAPRENHRMSSSLTTDIKRLAAQAAQKEANKG